VDAWRTPKRIRDADPPDHFAQLRADLRSPSGWVRLPTPVAAKSGSVLTHERLRPDDRENLQDCWKPAIQLDKEPAIMVLEPDAIMHNQLMSKRRVLSFKPQLRLEWQGHDGQNEMEQADHSASLGDSTTASTRIRFSVHTALPRRWSRVGRTSHDEAGCAVRKRNVNRKRSCKPDAFSLLRRDPDHVLSVVLEMAQSSLPACPTEALIVLGAYGATHPVWWTVRFASCAILYATFGVALLVVRPIWWMIRSLARLGQDANNIQSSCARNTAAAFHSGIGHKAKSVPAARPRPSCPDVANSVREASEALFAYKRRMFTARSEIRETVTRTLETIA
jgi:hypothetical protein